MYIKQAATVTWRPALFYCLYDSRLCTYGLSSAIPAKRHSHNPQTTSSLIGISTILQRYFNDISTMHIVEVSSKYRYTVVEICGFEWADRPGLVFMVLSNTCVSLVYFIWMSYQDVTLYLKVSAKNLTISGLSMIDVAFNCNSPLPKILSGFML